MTPTPTTLPLWRRAFLLAGLALSLAAAALLGWVYGTDSAIAAASLRAQRTAVAHDAMLQAERARADQANAVAAAATQRAAVAQRQARMLRAELRDLRATFTPLDTATGAPAGACL